VEVPIRQLGRVFPAILVAAAASSGCLVQPSEAARGARDAGNEADARGSPGALPAPDGNADSFPSGSKSCGGVAKCMGTCEEGDDPCFRDCFESGTRGAQRRFATFARCLEDRGCREENCICTDCRTEAEECVSNAC